MDEQTIEFRRRSRKSFISEVKTLHSGDNSEGYVGKTSEVCAKGGPRDGTLPWLAPGGRGLFRIGQRATQKIEIFCTVLANPEYVYPGSF